MSSSTKPKVASKNASKLKKTKSSESDLFEEIPDEGDSSEYSDMENDLNNDDTNIIIDEEGPVEDEEDEDDEDDDEDGESDDEDLIPNIARQSDRTNLLKNQRAIRVVKLTKKEDFITPNILSRFEHAAMICNRAAHLEKGAPPLVDIGDQTDELGITMKEFKEGKIPFMTSRQVGNKVEWHSASEMQLNAHILNVLKDV
jgi:DNA-directed RNA polymerase subunit K/omega